MTLGAAALVIVERLTGRLPPASALPGIPARDLGTILAAAGEPAAAPAGVP